MRAAAVLLRVPTLVGCAGGAVRGSGDGGSRRCSDRGDRGVHPRSLQSQRTHPPTYKNFVNHCLLERGYEPVGWQ